MKADNIRYLMELLRLRSGSFATAGIPSTTPVAFEEQAKLTALNRIAYLEREIAEELQKLLYDRSTVHESTCVCLRCRDYKLRSSAQNMQTHIASALRKSRKRGR